MMFSSRASSFTGTKLVCAQQRGWCAPRAPLRIEAARKLDGIVVSAKMDKTAVILVERYKELPKYGKRVKRSKKYLVHDEHNECEEGDFIQVKEVPQVSKRKSATLDKILRKVIKL